MCLSDLSVFCDPLPIEAFAPPLPLAFSGEHCPSCLAAQFEGPFEPKIASAGIAPVGPQAAR